MNTFKMYLMLALGWLGSAWRTVVNFAPWRAILLTWVLMILFRITVDMALYLAFGWTLPAILGFILDVGFFILVYTKVVYPRVYPNGWKKE